MQVTPTHLGVAGYQSLDLFELELLAVPRRRLGIRIGHIHTRLLELEDVFFVFEVLASFLDLLDTGLVLHVEFGMVFFWVFDGTRRTLFRRRRITSRYFLHRIHTNPIYSEVVSPWTPRYE